MYKNNEFAKAEIFWNITVLSHCDSITVQKIMETWHFFVFFFHHSACQKCFFTAKCSPSQGGPIPLERLNICNQTHSAQQKKVFLQPSILRVNQTCTKIKCKMSSKQALITKNDSTA